MAVVGDCRQAGHGDDDDAYDVGQELFPIEDLVELDLLLQ